MARRHDAIIPGQPASACVASHTASHTELAAQIAQLVEQRTENPRVRGSTPRLGTEESSQVGVPPGFGDASGREAGPLIPLICRVDGLESATHLLRTWVAGLACCPDIRSANNTANIATLAVTPISDETA